MTDDIPRMKLYSVERANEMAQEIDQLRRRIEALELTIEVVHVLTGLSDRPDDIVKIYANDLAAPVSCMTRLASIALKCRNAEKEKP